MAVSLFVEVRGIEPRSETYITRFSTGISPLGEIGRLKRGKNRQTLLALIQSQSARYWAIACGITPFDSLVRLRKGCLRYA